MESNYGTLLGGGYFFEAPRWHEGRWWVSDQDAKAVYSIDPNGDLRTIADVPGRPSGLGWLPEGDLLVCSMDDNTLFRVQAGGALSVHSDLAALAVGNINDMVVAADGTAYVGCTGMSDDSPDTIVTATRLIQVDPDGRARHTGQPLVCANGAAIDTQQRTLYVGESLAGRYTAFDIAPDGSLCDARVWAQLSPPSIGSTVADVYVALEFVPDGCARDADGRIWSADLKGRRCCLVEAGGVIVTELAAPDGLAFIACALGGPDGRTLLLCASPGWDPESRMRRESVLLTTRVSVGAG